MDALTFSTSQSALSAFPVTAAKVIATGMIANNILKAVVTLTIGVRDVRGRAGLALLGLAAVGTALVVTY
jgi:hypothetical protein